MLENTHQIHILVVEDSPTQAEELRFILEKRGYTVSLTGNGGEALAVLHDSADRQHPPDVVITDVVMPEMDGYELCKAIRADGQLKDMPVILVTSLSDPTDVIRGLEAGANNFITKPYDERYLTSRLQYLLTNRELRKNAMAEMGINVYFSGQNYFITAERLQILDLLLSTYESAYHQNRDLLAMQEELRDLNERLEDIVMERTNELLSANRQLKFELAERLRAEEEKARLQDLLNQAQKMEMVGRLAGGVAHDYNNMLSVILGYTQFALEETDASLPLHHHLEEILSAAERSVRITRQLLTFARKQTIVPEVLDLNDTVTGMIKMLQRLIGEDIALNWRPSPELWPVKLDPSQIDQVLANLCVNARDAITDVGRIDIETGMATFEADYCARHPTVIPGEYVVLTVSDNGCGMDQQVLARIFEPFFTTKAMGQGTGLGLSIVYGIVQQHNGFVHVYSEPGLGTTFRIYLPRHTGGAGALQKARVEKIRRGLGETILVVEDEEAILNLIIYILTDLGYTVLRANRASEAISLAENQEGAIDLLLIDMIMPEMNGRDLAAKLLTLHPQSKCLYMSGYAAHIIESQEGMDRDIHLMQKPFSAKELAAKVRETLES